MTNKLTFKVDGQVLTMERVFDAPHALVFEAHSTAEHLKHWWGPNGWILSACTVDFRPGGVWHYCMKCIDQNQGDFFGFESWGKAVYKEIVTNEKIAYVDYFSDAEGNESADMPSANVTMTFEATEDGKTKFVSVTRYPTEEALKTVVEMGMEQGISETSDRLVAYLEELKSS
ncbi:ATPase [Paenibacillus sp. BIHB 4019]|uniref:ATPase n=1 Tax=Paenibacillus sp. BIHB 4019 TaxID=1870819 RepID=A0A1B2DCL9_9BACL|nr:SRPBCC domain-containing protein [Paenibacillus sp. BIHB 4019]ANY65448.1 ATPase [Paenibacillus sp. BIHB 4019]